MKIENCKLKIISNKAFSLTELLIVIAIIAILSVIVFPYYGSARKQFALQRSANKLAQDIRRAQGMAMSAKELPGEGVPSGGYGVYFDKNWEAGKKYRIYADTAPSDGNEFYTLADTIVETLELEERIFLYGINTSPQKVSINFKPPDPVVKIKYQESGGGVESVTITICIQGTNCLGSNIKIIFVNKAGLIYVK